MTLPYDFDNPPPDPPAGVDSLLWRVAYALQTEHVTGPDGWCVAGTCRGQSVLWPCEKRKLAEIGLLNAADRRASLEGVLSVALDTAMERVDGIPVLVVYYGEATAARISCSTDPGETLPGLDTLLGGLWRLRYAVDQDRRRAGQQHETYRRVRSMGEAGLNPPPGNTGSY